MPDNNADFNFPNPPQIPMTEQVVPPPQGIVKKTPSNAGVQLWAKLLTVFFALSVLAALAVLYSGKKPASPNGKDGASIIGAIKEKSIGKDNSIALVAIKGVISEQDSSSPFEHGASDIAQRIVNYGKKDHIKAVLLDINSPGGSVGAVQDISAAILKVRKEYKKPVVALFRDVSASGGYYIACACDKIIAYPGTITGSIGVIFQTGDMQGLLQKVGLSMRTIKSGKHKDIGSPFRNMTPEERALLQELINEAYNDFFNAVQTARKIEVPKLKLLADGRILSGRQAFREGLVDGLGGYDEAIQTIAQLAGIKGEPRIVKQGRDIEDFFVYFSAKLGDIGFNAKKTQSYLGPKLSYLWAY